MNNLPPMVTQPAQPQVIRWFKVYAAVRALIYASFLLFGGFLLFVVILQIVAPNSDGPKPDTIPMMIFGGIVIMLLGIALIVVYLLPFFLKPKSWVWIYNLVLICLGFGSVCTLPFCIWMLIYWLKPEVKNFYGRT